MNVPSDLFSQIIGYDEIKYWLRRSLESEKPVHILIVGPPGLAKSMFAEDLYRLRDHGWRTLFVDGANTTDAGLRDELRIERPDLLIVDNVDKLQSGCYDLLLEVMEHGRLTIHKKTMDYRRVWRQDSCSLALPLRVYGFGNTTKGIPKTFLDRCITFQLEEYDPDECFKIAVEILKREGVDPQLAEYIAKNLANHLGLKDVRHIRNVARLCRSREDVDRFIGLQLKARRQKVLHDYVSHTEEAGKPAGKPSDKGLLRWSG